MTIIVLLILAGVSLNAIIGDNGIITQAMNTNFVAEMTEVQEAFDEWKIHHYEDGLLPANGLVKRSDIVNNGRIYGEIAYYRNWAQDKYETKPSVSVTADLNKVYAGELIYMPRGVEDLFYLDNKKIGINSNKKYIIDAVNSTVYSLEGYLINDIDVHSIYMYNAIKSGDNVSPMFASGEVSGAGGNIVYAGAEYFMDTNGNYVDENGKILSEDDEKVVNPYGFKIIGKEESSNLYKLYNNGDLYAKGYKGYTLNTSSTEMENFNDKVFSKINIPEIIPGYDNPNKIDVIATGYNFYVIDENNELWGWGDNSYNQLGLTPEEKIEFSNLEAHKFNFNGKELYKFFPGIICNFFVLKSGNNYELWACGANGNGQLRKWKNRN